MERGRNREGATAGEAVARVEGVSLRELEEVLTRLVQRAGGEELRCCDLAVQVGLAPPHLDALLGHEREAGVAPLVVRAGEVGDDGLAVRPRRALHLQGDVALAVHDRPQAIRDLANRRGGDRLHAGRRGALVGQRLDEVDELRRARLGEQTGLGIGDAREDIGRHDSLGGEARDEGHLLLGGGVQGLGHFWLRFFGRCLLRNQYSTPLRR